MEKKGRGRKLDGVTEAGKTPAAMELTDGRNKGTERGSGSLYAGWGGAQEGSRPWWERRAQEASGATALQHTVT
jgi:hypothetical protein